ncbi:MAG: cytochrome c3 family protein [Desulfohalobiaceae bacterium]|nr:cytochrome c3 family protein [Desulfohalobiaceae bacterium]
MPSTLVTFPRAATVFLLALLVFPFLPGPALAAEPSQATQYCLGCHKSLHPGIVSDWRASRHARVTSEEALEKEEMKRRISAESVPEDLADSTVGCAECHTLNPGEHPDTFAHNGKKVHAVVTPKDCAVCHPEEREQFSRNKMSQAHGNLMDNKLYQQLITAINGVPSVDPEQGTVQERAPDRLSNQDSCLACHGTRVEYEGTKERSTKLGPQELPVYTGWPNQAVGRINPDGSKGSCSSCHTRHRFAIEMARQPHTCSKCHKGPDVPAYKVYRVSKHGNIQASLGSEWAMEEVPWTPGEDFAAPTCASCHASLLTSPQGKVIAERTHQMNDRLSERIFGLPYAHPQPQSADTSVIENKAGLPLPTELSGEPASKYLISKEEQEKRRGRLQAVCSACHSTQWTRGHFEKLDRAVETSNQMTREATKVLEAAWAEGLAQGPGNDGSIADEPLELMWLEQWLFYANSVRFASAMMGADYGVFERGRWQQQKNLREMLRELKRLRREAR